MHRPAARPQARTGTCLGSQLFDLDAMEAIRRHHVGIERIFLVPGLGQVAFGKGVIIDDQDAAILQIREVRLQRRGIHRDESAYPITRSPQLLRTKVELKPAHPGERTQRSADFRRKIGKRTDIVAEDRRCIRQLRTGKLHPIARVAAKTNGDFLELDDLMRLFLGLFALGRNDHIYTTLLQRLHFRRCRMSNDRPFIMHPHDWSCFVPASAAG